MCSIRSGDVFARSTKHRGSFVMGDASRHHQYIGLTAEIVSAYVSNNTVASADIPALINQVHTALLRVTNGEAQPPSEPLKPAVPVKKFDQSRLHRLPGGRQEVQIAQAPSAHAVQHDAGAIPGEMEPAGRLSDGGAELRRRPLATRQADGTGPAAPPPALESRFCSRNRGSLAKRGLRLHDFFG